MQQDDVAMLEVRDGFKILQAGNPVKSCLQKEVVQFLAEEFLVNNKKKTGAASLSFYQCFLLQAALYFKFLIHVGMGFQHSACLFPLMSEPVDDGCRPPRQEERSAGSGSGWTERRSVEGAADLQTLVSEEA